MATLESRVRDLPDSLFQSVEMEDLLEDQVYMQLLREGWKPDEVMSVMKKTIADKKTAKYKDGYIHYAKEVVPIFRRMIGGDTLAMIMDTVFTQKMRASVEATVPSDLLNAYWPPLDYYPPKDRPNTERLKGYFRQPLFYPSCGRICWMTIHPEDPDKLYVGPDGAGIFKTEDGGKHWECITDRIPLRADRANVNGYSIPVDPDDWDHVFAMMNNSAVYETCDGGKSWRKIQGATHKGFKRGDCFRDADGNLKFIGCTTTNWNSTLWISEDTCKTWTAVVVPDSIKDINPANGNRGLWFQYIVPDPVDRNKIYLPTSRSILYFDDGAKSTMENGKRVYNIKKMHFKVYDEAGNRRYANHSADRGADETNDAIFPCPANCVGDLVINPNKPTQWWFATGSNCCGMGDCTAVYRSEDGGKTWTTLQDLAFHIGSGCVFGNELANVWLGGFGVNFADTTKLYGCSMSSAKSTDGGRTFNNYHWAIALASEHDPQLYLADTPHELKAPGFITVSASRHNADNHCIRSHKSGRVFRGSDGGMLMIDPKINNGEWCQIGSNMGQMLFYHVAVNEFGDQCIAGNTQDIDGQTYRYGRWGSWRGYEGSESFINPYTGAVYFSGMGYVGWEDLPISSWYNAQTRADVVSGSWYFTRAGVSGRSFNRCDDLGKTSVPLESTLGETIGWQNKFGLCRDKGVATVFVLTNSNKLKKSTDNGNTWEVIRDASGNPLDLPNRVIATDPDNSDIIYAAHPGNLWRFNMVTKTWDHPGGSTLPSIPCTQLLYHEGSGDIYYFHSGSGGIYILESNGKDANGIDNYDGKSWRFWTKGYNSGKATNVEINYTTQEMVICDYGRGVWCADLEHPSDRYFKENFPLKEYSFRDGRRTIGIDTYWTIPLYYYYKWIVNDEVIDNPYQYLRRALNPGDRVQLELTLRESPDVTTHSAVFVVPEVGIALDEENEDNESQNNESQAIATQGNIAQGNMAQGNVSQANLSLENPSGESVSQENASINIRVDRAPGQVLYSNGRGRVDLGYYDYFFDDFTIDFWLKPQGDGTILANRTRDGDNKGWELMIESGAVKFDYSPRYSVNQPRYEVGITQTANVRGGSVGYGSWNHIALTHQRNGQIVLYLNGKNVASAARIIPDATLNSAMILSLFGDGIEKRTIEASIDELKIWTKALTEEEIRKEMYSTNVDNKDGLVAYWPFNGGTLENDLETFTRRAPKSRILAETTHNLMTVPTCARYVSYEPLAKGGHDFTADGANVLSVINTSEEITDANASLGKCGVYAYDASQWQNEEDNLDTDFFDYHPVGYFLHQFDNISKNTDWEFEFHPVEGEFNPQKTYRVYATDINGDKQVWENIGTARYNEENGTIHLSGVDLADVAEKKLLIVTVKPSIELQVEGIGADGVLPVYDRAAAIFPITANILEGLPEPAGAYKIESDGILKPGDLYFADGIAKGELRLDVDKLGPFNSTVSTTLRSPDNNLVDEAGKPRPSLIPMKIDVRNRIAPREIGAGLYLDRAHADIGNQAQFSGMLGKNTLTMMGWVRIDSVNVLKHGGFNIITSLGTSGVTGIRINQNRLEYAQNGRVIWTINNSNMRISEDMLGKWIHIAVVKEPGENKLRMYLNGSYVTGRFDDVVTTAGCGILHLGKNSPLGQTNNDDSFKGAFDQVAVWNRALSHEEVIKYMYSPVPLNDEGLLSYLNMDYFNENSKPMDIAGMTEIKTYPTPGLNGAVSFGEVSSLPFDSRKVESCSNPDATISLDFSTGNRQAWVSTFRGAPYCYLNHDFQNYSALNQEFYGVTFNDRLTTAPGPDDVVTVTYRHRSIVGDEPLAVAMRRTGTFEHLAGFVHATTVEPGVATFTVPMTYLAEASEIMFFTYPRETGGTVTERPAILTLTFPQQVTSKLTDTDKDVPTLILTGEEESIGVLADVMALARNYDRPVEIVVNESAYATPSQETIDFSSAENQFSINLNKEKMDLFGVNPVTISLQGATANQLKLNLIFEPYVELTLENGDHRDIVTPGSNNGGGTAQTNTFRSTSPVANLEINAQLIRGFMPEGEQVKLEVISDLDNSLVIGNGSLLKDDAVTYEPLEHHPSEEGSLHEGWNLIGNPYLANINLTKSQNVDYDPESVTKFLYQCDPVTGNYSVFDMTDYSTEHQIHPFQSYFVQVMKHQATFTVTPVAKEVEPTKKTRAYSVVEKQALVLDLDDDDKRCDRVTVDFNSDADPGFVTNEDAPKMWNMNGSTPELFALTADNKETTVSSTADNNVVLGVKSPEEKTMTLKLISMDGLEDRDLTIHDNVTGQDWVPTAAGDTYEFTAEPGTDNNRFSVGISDLVTTGVSSATAEAYSVEVEDHICTVKGLKGDAVIRIFTPGGLNIVTQQTSAPTFSIYLENGVYIVTIHDNGKDYTSKIAVQ